MVRICKRCPRQGLHCCLRQLGYLLLCNTNTCSTLWYKYKYAHSTNTIGCTRARGRLLGRKCSWSGNYPPLELALPLLTTYNHTYTHNLWRLHSLVYICTTPRTTILVPLLQALTLVITSHWLSQFVTLIQCEIPFDQLQTNNCNMVKSRPTI